MHLLRRTVPSSLVRLTFAALTALSLVALGACNGGPFADLPADRTAVVTTTSGEVIGEHIAATDNAEAVDVFRGIPYAAPPVGELRWQPPQDPASWSDPREMVDFGARCPQPVRVSEDGVRYDEDCLTLNIWTTSDRSGQRPNPTIVPEQRPVFVWIHGGGFRTGSGSAAYSNGTRFVEEGAVLVTINYRLGALGFLAHPTLLAQQPNANFGLLDMRKALEWVNQNISAFGGDNNNVTIFGESAGGMAIQLLMSQPKVRFQQAISMSGYGTWPLPRVPAKVPEGKEAAGANPFGNRAVAPILSATAMGEEIIQAALDTASLDSGTDIREIPVTALTDAVASLHLPIVDGASLPDEPALVFARGAQAPVPYMAGGNSYDGAVMAMAGLSPTDFLASWGEWQDDLRALYAEDFANSDDLGASRLFGDGRYLLAARLTARQMQTVGQPGFLYYYDFVPQANRGQWPGTPHAAELATLFDPPNPEAEENSQSESTAEARAVGRAFRRTFIEFARIRKPKGSDWPPTDATADQWFVIGREGELATTPGVLKDKLDFLEGHYHERVAAQGIATGTSER